MASAHRPPSTPVRSQTLARPNARLLVWGRNDMGQLGLGGQQQAVPGDSESGLAVLEPTVVEALAGRGVVGLAGGPFHSAFVTADGELSTCGCNANAQLGRRAVSAAAAAAATAVGRGGDGSNNAGGGGSSSTVDAVPRRVSALDAYRVAAAGCGTTHSMVLTEQGAVLAWGGNEFGQTGAGAEGPDQQQLRPVKGLADQRVVRVAVGANHALLLTGAGAVLAVGQGSYGALGLGGGALENRSVPVPIPPLAPLGVLQVAAGENHSAALTADGRVFTWGRGKYGQLGHGNWDNQSAPLPVAALWGTRAKQVACGWDHTLVVMSPARLDVGGCGGGGTLYTFGRGTWGATGLGTTDNACRPCQVQGLQAEAVVQASAGSRHSLVLTASHTVFAFGSNDFGQLGLGRDAANKRRTAGDSGAGGSVQSVHASPRRVSSLPALPVLCLLAAGDSSMALLQECRPGAPASPGPHTGGRCGMYDMPYNIPDLQHLAAAVALDPRALRAVVVAVKEVLPSPAFVLSMFSDPQVCASAVPRYDSPPTPYGSRHAFSPIPGFGAFLQQRAEQQAKHGMDVCAIQSCFEALLRLFSGEVATAVGDSLLRLLDAAAAAAAAAAVLLGASGPSVTAGGSHSLLRVLFVVYQCPLLARAGPELDLASSLVDRLLDVTARLPAELQQRLCEWLVSLPAELLGRRVVRPLQRYLLARAMDVSEATTHQHFHMAVASRKQMLAAARVLAGLHAANEELPVSQAGGKLPASEFQNAALSTEVNLRIEYVRWLQVDGGGPAPNSRAALFAAPLVSLCQVPALLTPDAKSRIMQGEANIQMEEEMQARAREAMLQGLNPDHAVSLSITVRRSHLVADATQQISARAHQLKLPLRVSFVSQGVMEEGVDQGGVSREFFQLLVAEIFQPQYGMFLYSEETRTHWFNPAFAALGDDPSAVGEFRMVGALLGLAIYNGVILDVHLPQVVYKKLLGEAVGLSDVGAAFPALGRSFQAILTMDPGLVEETLCRTFEVEVDCYGGKCTVPLIPGGAATPVTGANVRQYVSRMVEWTLNEGVETQFRALSQGFHQVCGGPALSLFRAEELELLICGLPHLDFAALQSHARYDGCYHPDHPTIKMFWQVLSQLDLEQKRRFLAFATGCDRAPVAGLGALVFTITRSGPDSDRLPSAHTCFNTLLLPDYNTREKLRAKLLTAIENAQGFGLR